MKLEAFGNYLSNQALRMECKVISGGQLNRMGRWQAPAPLEV